MFKQKKLLLKKVKDYVLDFSSFANGVNENVDDNLLPIKYAKKCYNFTVKNGALKTGLGFNVLHLPHSYDTYENKERAILPAPDGKAILGVWHHKYYSTQMHMNRHRVVFHTEDGMLYFFPALSPLNDYYTLFPPFNMHTFEGKIDAFNYHLNNDDSLIFVIPEEEKILVFKSGENTTIIENAPNLVTFGLHYERLFAVLEGNRKRLIFSANLDPTNFNAEENEGGFIDLYDERGRINKIISFNDYVYVFRDYGVSKVSAYGDQNDFSVSQLFVSSSKIYGQSVASCGDRIMFLAKDGIHAFDGYNTTRLSLNIEKMFKTENNDNCFGLFYQNKYYLACRMNFGDDKKIDCEANEDGFQNNALIEYNIKTGDLNILRGIDIRSMLAIEESNVSKLVACFNGQFKSYLGELDESGKLFGEPIKSYWQSPLTNLGYPDQIKIVKEILIKTSTDCVVTIKTDSEEKSYAVCGKQTSQRIKTNAKGKDVQISFETNSLGDVLISRPQITVGVVQ